MVGNKDQPTFYDVYDNIQFKRIMTDDSPRLKYASSKLEAKFNFHFGQRKLLISEIEFLTLYGHLSDTVVYVGAAPGTHIPLLTHMFPKHKFYLYDPSPFSYRVAGNLELGKKVDEYIPRVYVIRDFFNDEESRKWNGKNVLFISDIRTANFEVDPLDVVERDVEKDMNWQMAWCNFMKPAYASLKFRLPWSEGTTKYLDGDIHIQVWQSPTSTESRLFTDCKRLKIYDNKKYEEQFFYHNHVSRTSLYKLSKCDDKNFDVHYDHCYDCNGEYFVLCQYIQKYFPKGLTLEEFFKKFKFQTYIHGDLFQETDETEKLKFLKKKQYDARGIPFFTRPE